MDIGFVNHLNQIDLLELDNLITSNEGALAEQYVAQELLTTHPAYLSPELYYWSREEKNSNAEVDFIFQHNNKIYPIEVKAGKTGTEPLVFPLPGTAGMAIRVKLHAVSGAV